MERDTRQHYGRTQQSHSPSRKTSLSHVMILAAAASEEEAGPHSVDHLFSDLGSFACPVVDLAASLVAGAVAYLAASEALGGQRFASPPSPPTTALP